MQRPHHENSAAGDDSEKRPLDPRGLLLNADSLQEKLQAMQDYLSGVLPAPATSTSVTSGGPASSTGDSSAGGINSDPSASAPISAAVAGEETLAFKITRRFAQLLMVIGVIGEVTFEVFTYQQLVDFAFGNSSTSAGDLPTESFLSHFGMDVKALRVIARMLIGLLIAGDSITNFLTIDPLNELDDAIAAIKNHAPLTEAQARALPNNRQRSSFVKQIIGDLIFKWSVVPLTFVHYLAGASSDPSGTFSLINKTHDTLRKAVGWTLWMGGVTYYYAMTFPNLLKHLRLGENAYYSQDFSLLNIIKNHPLRATITSIETLIVMLTRVSTFIFLGDVGLSVLPPLGIPASQSSTARKTTEGVVGAASVYTVGITRPLNTINNHYPADEQAFQIFCRDHQLINDRKLFLGTGWGTRVIEAVVGLSYGFFPGWMAGYFTHEALDSNDNYAHPLKLFLTGLAAVAAAAPLAVVYYASVKEKYLIQAHKIYAKVIELRTNNFEGQENISSLNDLQTTQETLRALKNDVMELKKAAKKHHLPLPADFQNMEKELDQKQKEVMTKITQVEQFLHFFKQLQNLVASTNANHADPQIQAAVALYTALTAQQRSWGVNIETMAHLIATGSNFLSQMTRQLCLVHFCVVLANNWFGATNGMYNHALAFSLSLGLSILRNNFELYQPLVEANLKGVLRAGQKYLANSEIVRVGAGYLASGYGYLANCSSHLWCGKKPVVDADAEAARAAAASAARPWRIPSLLRGTSSSA